MDYVYPACAVHVTTFSTGDNFRPVSNFTELHTLTLAACSYVLLVCYYMAPDTVQKTAVHTSSLQLS